MQPPEIRDRGYANPGLIVDTNWLSEHLDDPNLRVIDARFPNEYAEAHLPGAVNLNGFGAIPRSEDGDMASSEVFATLVGGLGIGNKSTVVVYDTPDQRMGMVAWAFLYYGHPDVRILDGGLAKWAREGRPVSNDQVEYPSVTFVPELQDGIHCSLERAKGAVDGSKAILWDTRSLEEFEGTRAGFGPPVPMGRIPGSIHLDWVELFDQESNTLKPAGELTALLASKGITPESEINAY